MTLTNKYITIRYHKVILRTTEHLFSLNTSKSLLRETITRISKTSHALSKHQNIIYTIEVAYSGYTEDNGASVFAEHL